MKRVLHTLPAALTIVAALHFLLSTAFAQTTAFTYQGRLNDGANPANGSYDLQFSLWDAPSGPAQVGGTITNAATPVSNGLFTVVLDFGNQFPGSDRWLEIGVVTNGGGAFTTLTPRQKITATPYAVTARSVTGSIGLAQLPQSLHGSRLDYRFTQSDGNGTESSNNTWFRVGAFVYRGTSAEGSPSQALALMYTTNPGTWHRLRLFDVTNGQIIALSAQSDLGTLAAPTIVQLGPFGNLPAAAAVFEVQLLATDATGTTGILGRQSVGIHSFQMY